MFNRKIFRKESNYYTDYKEFLHCCLKPIFYCTIGYVGGTCVYEVVYMCMHVWRAEVDAVGLSQ